MKREKKVIVLFLVFLIILNLFLILTPDPLGLIGNSLVDIKATYDDIGLSISIDDTPPDVLILSPRNITYNHRGPIHLDYFITDKVSTVSEIWFNIDDKANMSTSQMPFPIFHVNTPGTHTLNLFARDSAGFVNHTESITFFVDESLGHQIITDYDSMPNLHLMTREQHEKIENFELGRNNIGKIFFLEFINLSHDTSENSWEPPRKIINLRDFTNISFNRIYLDSENLPELNKPATLTLEGLSFENPRILKDEIACGNACNILSYISGTLTFNVDSFSTYSAEEISSGTPTISSGGSSKKYSEIEPHAVEDIQEELPEPIHQSGDMFDINLHIPEKYKEVQIEEDIIAEITAINLRRIGLVDTFLTYSIRNQKGDILFEEIETRGVEGMISFLKKIELPSDTPEGIYMFFVELEFGEDKAIAASPFRIIKEKENIANLTLKKLYTIFIINILLLFAFFIYLERLRYHKMEKLIHKFHRR